jgi:hypothetical protein
LATGVGVYNSSVPLDPTPIYRDTVSVRIVSFHGIVIGRGLWIYSNQICGGQPWRMGVSLSHQLADGGRIDDDLSEYCGKDTCYVGHCASGMEWHVSFPLRCVM